jgi:endo-alpha-1,4-polygalactosaminidase (GH114 family)
MPEPIRDEPQRQMKRVVELHTNGYDGVFLDDTVEKKYPKVPKEMVHRGVFTAKRIDTGGRDRAAAAGSFA